MVSVALLAFLGLAGKVETTDFLDNKGSREPEDLQVLAEMMDRRVHKVPLERGG